MFITLISDFNHSFVLCVFSLTLILPTPVYVKVNSDVILFQLVSPTHVFPHIEMERENFQDSKALSVNGKSIFTAFNKILCVGVKMYEVKNI